MGLGSSGPEIHAMAVTLSGDVLAVGSIVVERTAGEEAGSAVTDRRLLPAAGPRCPSARPWTRCPVDATIGSAGPGPMSPTSPDSRRSARAPYGRALVAVVLLLTLTASGAAVLPQQTGRVDLLSQPSLRIDGAAALDQAGASVAGAGDVNGDGLDDLLVGAPERGPLDAGAAYVVFGRETPENVNLGALGRDGFRITGAAGDDRAGVAVAGAGDVNGDGLDDVLVGADLADNNGRSGSGSAYVVFGRRAADNVDLADLGEAGFRIDGAASSDGAGASVAGAGDMNGDGLDDLLVGAPGGGLLVSSGAAYVVFGQETSTNVDLDALGAGGFRMNGVGVRR